MVGQGWSKGQGKSYKAIIKGRTKKDSSWIYFGKPSVKIDSWSIFYLDTLLAQLTSKFIGGVD